MEERGGPDMEKMNDCDKRSKDGPGELEQLS